MIWIIIFLIGLVGVFVMLYREVLHIRKHNLAFEDINDKTLVSREKVADLTDDLWYLVKLNSHRAIISVLKSWVIFTHKINKSIKDRLAKRPEGSENGAVSTFLTTVSDYKHKMKKMRERLKQKDE